MAKKGEYDYDYSLGKEWIKCKCPTCETIHKLKMAWIGNGQPRKLCIKCKKSNDTYETSFPGVIFDTGGTL